MSQQSYGVRATAANLISVGSAWSPPPLRPPGARRFACGASHWEIAETLVGEPRVQADWTDPHDHLRDRIRRAIHRGHALMNGGYRALVAKARRNALPFRQLANKSL
ncbi:DNA -binding domain-containing protein [Mesorhizobium sp. AaZ16]|uniref:DNA -binding domain-containing protein n=1 Tax=Mesorhizobium sp. AaZ16 TaxID=3402289 RepID=UPI00374E68EA